MAEPKPSGGVKNLRAMFENQTGNANSSTSPPSRGRSPADSNASRTERPLSKVRASFVAVERTMSSGGTQIGLRSASEAGRQTPTTFKQNTSVAENGSPPQKAGASENETMSTTSGTNGTGEAPESAQNGLTLERKPSVRKDPTKLEEKDQTSLGNGAITATGPKAMSTQESSAADKVPSHATESPSFKSSPSKTVAPSAKEATSSRKTTTAARPKGISTGNTKMNSKTSPTLPKTPSTAGPQSKKTPPKKTTKSPTKDQAKGTVARPGRISTVGAPGPAARTSSRAREASNTRASSRARTAVRSPSSHPALPTHTSPSHKPKPKSPTRPVRLPASATAPTAASAAKLGNGANHPPPRSHSRADQTTSKLHRKPSTLKKDHSTTASKATAATSTISQKQAPRPSLPQNHGKSGTNSNAQPPNEGFLARMMRPTASSASKTHDKTEVKSPSRKTTVKPHRKNEEIANAKHAQPTTVHDNQILQEDNGLSNNLHAAAAEERYDVQPEATLSAEDAADMGSPAAQSTKGQPVERVSVGENPVVGDTAKEETGNEGLVEEEIVKKGPVEKKSVEEEPVKEEPLKEDLVKEEPLKEKSVKEDAVIHHTSISEEQNAPVERETISTDSDEQLAPLVDKGATAKESSQDIHRPINVESGDNFKIESQNEPTNDAVSAPEHEQTSEDSSNLENITLHHDSSQTNVPAVKTESVVGTNVSKKTAASPATIEPEATEHPEGSQPVIDEAQSEEKAASSELAKDTTMAETY